MSVSHLPLRVLSLSAATPPRGPLEFSMRFRGVDFYTDCDAHGNRLIINVRRGVGQDLLTRNSRWARLRRALGWR